MGEPGSPFGVALVRLAAVAPRPRSKAQEHLTTATTLYREMKMSYWLERMEAERAEPS